MFRMDSKTAGRILMQFSGNFYVSSADGSVKFGSDRKFKEFEAAGTASIL